MALGAVGSPLVYLYTWRVITRSSSHLMVASYIYRTVYFWKLLFISYRMGVNL